MSRLEKKTATHHSHWKKLPRITLNLNTAHTLILILTFHAFSHSDSFTSYTDLHRWIIYGENEPSDMNLFLMEVLQYFHKLAQRIYFTFYQTWTICEWTVIEIVNKEWFLWVEAECENVQQNKETREEKKKPSGRMLYNFVTMLSLSIILFLYIIMWLMFSFIVTGEFWGTV